MNASIHITPHLLAVALTAAIVAASGVWQSSRSRSLLRHWAAEHGFEILRRSYRCFARGPFSWSSRGQDVYYVTVRDSRGREHSAWVNCGGLFGRWLEKPEVRWEQQT